MALYINGNKIGGGGGNSNMQELTQEEYDELTTEEKNNGTVYYITDVNGDGESFQPIIYSENEREVGVWVDRKPLYEKTFVTTSPSQADTVEVVQDITSLNVDTPINIYGHIGNVPLNWELELNYNSCFINQAKTGIVMSVGNSLTSNISYITIQYTKTTDTAGSGTWTPQGVPAVHYSMDEQVIGTWIDGSTLYQKVIEYATPFNIPHDSWYTSTESYSDVDLIVNAWCINSSGAVYNGIIVVIENNKLVIGNQTYNQPINNLKYVIIQYTKSSQGGN